MKKILLGVAVLLMTVQVAFAARESGMDLVDIFGANQLGAGYDDAEWDTALYSDFGTDKLRFSVNLYDMGGSWYNNGDLKDDGSAVPFQNGMPKFFVAAGYKFSDSFRAAIGYGGALERYNKGSTDVSKDDLVNRSEGGYYGNDISVFFQVNAGQNIIRFATPIQFGKGFGHKAATTAGYAYNMKDVSVFSMAPQIRWIGKLGPLVQVRFAVPFGFGTAKAQKDFDAGANWFKEKEVSSIGADLRLYLQFATDPVQVSFVPRVRYNQAMKGNRSSVSAMTGFGDNLEDTAGSLPFGNASYTAEKPWDVRADFAIELAASSDIISVWVAPQFGFYVAGSPKTIHTSGVHRRDALYGIGYGLPLELTVRPIANLEFNVGAEALGVTPLKGGSSTVGAKMDASVVWYF